jgi:hypothetical protein
MSEDGILISAKELVFQDPETLRAIIIERVQKGAELLRQNKPDWAIDINPEELDFRGIGKNIFEQLFDDPLKAAKELGIVGEETYYGFLPPRLSDSELLKEIWKVAIQKRLLEILSK